VLEKEKEAKKKPASTVKDAPASSNQDTAAEPSTSSNKPRRKPRKLNKDPTPATITTPPTNTTTPSAGEKPSEAAAAAELEALKSRVRGIEAKVEELYKNGTLERPGRSPRRRGKGRKMSSQQQVPTLASTTAQQSRVEEVQDDEGEEGVADEELVRLEGELEVARQDLAQYRPRGKRTASQQTSQPYMDDDEDIEEIPRGGGGDASGGSSKHVTLSGSYRIPLPAAVNTEDLKTIQSGVSAAQKLASGFLEQRRAAAAALRETQTSTPSSSSSAKPSPPNKTPRPAPRSVNSNMEIVKADESDGGKKSWSEWIGGYSVAITRAVKSIEHEAAVESQRATTQPTGPKRTAAGKKSGSASGSGTRKRPGVKTKLSGEQVDGLMS
jgi:hypothetical protein